MKLKQIGSNMTELHLNNGTIVLFSYETPVAAFTSTFILPELNSRFIKTSHSALRPYQKYFWRMPRTTSHWRGLWWNSFESRQSLSWCSYQCN